jgi:hypothetical protein
MPKVKGATRGPRRTSPKRVKFKYLFGDDFSPTYANGAHGQMTPQKEIAVSFYLERAPLPLGDIHVISEGGGIGSKVGQDPPVDQDQVLIIRHITNGVVLSLATAKRVQEMLGKLIARIEAKDKDQGKKS